MVLAGNKARAQKVDSIFFNLYTDSLKKGTYNYINVDARLSNGRYQPLTAKELWLTASAGTFDGNSLFIDTSFSGEKVTIKAVLKKDTALTRETTIYIKQYTGPEKLKTIREIMNEPREKTRKTSKTKATGHR